MGLFNQSIEKKREKEIRREAKEISKELAAFGMDKKATKEYLEVFQELLIDACLQKDCYVCSKQQMAECRLLIDTLLPDIAKKEANEVCSQLKQLVVLLQGIYHECTIRRDDLDFASTYAYIKKTAQEYDGSDRLMLQSELENLLHVVEETLEWEAPDFCALACLCKYGNRSDLAEIENHQRNEMIMRFYREQFWDGFERELEDCGVKERVTDWIKEKLEQREDM